VGIANGRDALAVVRTARRSMFMVLEIGEVPNFAYVIRIPACFRFVVELGQYLRILQRSNYPYPLANFLWNLNL